MSVCKYEGDSYSRTSRNNFQEFRKENERTRNSKKNWNSSVQSTAEIGKNTSKNPAELRRLVVTWKPPLTTDLKEKKPSQLVK